MKKIDLHIHTVPSISDTTFDFSLDKLKEYVNHAGLDCIAITNHNLFDLSQYKEIVSSDLTAKVYPGIEIDLEKGHILVISDNVEIEDFSLKCDKVRGKIKTKEDFLTFDDFRTIFPDFSRYILIPHYDKNPVLHENTIKKFALDISSGEVSSPKKFNYRIKDQHRLVPVLFSDYRIDVNCNNFPIRQTYIDVGELTLSAIKIALKDKSKVSLSKSKGHDFFEISENGLKLSNSLTVILGERSSGKTYTLDKIFNNSDNLKKVKYIKQFQLLERDAEVDKERIAKEQSLFIEDYLKELKIVVDDLENIDIEGNERDIEKYITTLLEHAKESDMSDSFAKTKLFTESRFSENELDSLKKLISSIILIIDNTEYDKIIVEHIDKVVLKRLVVQLMAEYIRKEEINLKKRWINDLVKSIQDELQIHTASTRIEDIDLYKITLEKKKVDTFLSIVENIKKERTIKENDVQNFKIIAKTEKFKNSGEMKKLSRSRTAFSNAFSNYSNAYNFIKELRQLDGLLASDYYKYFVKIDYQVLNKYGYPVSGGERSEFRLLQTIQDALHYDILLIDEPESSFDNVFLKTQVNQLIKTIAQSMPVVIVTHNNTVGASIKPNHVLYTERAINDNGEVNYEVYSGHPSDKCLVGINGGEMQNFEIMMNCLEAGSDAYLERSSNYEILKN